MKKIIVPLFTALALMALAVACAKVESTTSNDPEKEYLEAWLKVNHPSAKKHARGVYILDETIGTGTELTDETMKKCYAYLQYTVSSLDGTIASTYFEDVAKRIGSYDASSYYGAVPWSFQEGEIEAGLYDMMKGMKVGGTRTVLVPGWLMSYESYDTAEEYLKNETGASSIYTVSLQGTIEDVRQWQIDSIKKYSAKYLGGVDSTLYGHYYKTFIEPVDTAKLKADTTVYVNYVGRLLNGTVFDTNIADTAKLYGLYNESRSYAPTKVEIKEDYKDITFGGSSQTITGFKYALSKMKAFEKGRAVFISDLGYGMQGSQPTIPPFSPLAFDLELVDAPEN